MEHKIKKPEKSALLPVNFRKDTMNKLNTLSKVLNVPKSHIINLYVEIGLNNVEIISNGNVQNED